MKRTGLLFLTEWEAERLFASTRSRLRSRCWRKTRCGGGGGREREVRERGKV
ncbi:unnamed protein product [Spirodela intermedia]|uniref:Uncharacterized protein n=1 Tax=Spirodela intermedia TaxID=51605 RepID=A0ABN7EC41_SPIIN|nr:unnamed protein product [Spirodela intermedia]